MESAKKKRGQKRTLRLETSVAAVACLEPMPETYPQVLIQEESPLASGPGSAGNMASAYKNRKLEANAFPRTCAVLMITGCPGRAPAGTVTKYMVDLAARAEAVPLVACGICA